MEDQQPQVVTLRPEKCGCGVASGRMLREDEGNAFLCNNCQADRHGYDDTHMHEDEGYEQIRCSYCESTEFRLIRRHVSDLTAESEPGDLSIGFNTSYEDYELDSEEVECVGCARNLSGEVEWETY